MHEVTLDANNNKAYYAYNSGGERTRKVVVKGNTTEERIYFGDYEIYRKTINQQLDFERHTHHVNDDTKKVALTEYKTVENGLSLQVPVVTVRYQYDNHLGSASLELDENAQLITYEEYHPFGTTSYRAGRSLTETSLKRYKYVGKERDEETGLYYYGMRYYADWLCRFVSVDPLQFKYPHYTPFQYAGNKPITFIDLDGAEPTLHKNQNSSSGNAWQQAESRSKGEDNYPQNQDIKSPDVSTSTQKNENSDANKLTIYFDNALLQSAINQAKIDIENLQSEMNGSVQPNKEYFNPIEGPDIDFSSSTALGDLRIDFIIEGEVDGDKYIGFGKYIKRPDSKNQNKIEGVEFYSGNLNKGVAGSVLGGGDSGYLVRFYNSKVTTIYALFDKESYKNIKQKWDNIYANTYNKLLNTNPQLKDYAELKKAYDHTLYLLDKVNAKQNDKNDSIVNEYKKTLDSYNKLRNNYIKKYGK